MPDKSVRAAESARLKEIFEQRKSEAKQKGEVFGQANIAKIGGWTQPNVSSYLSGIVELKEESATIFSTALGVPVSAFSPRVAEMISRREMLSRNPLLKQVTVSYVPKYSGQELDVIRPRLYEPGFIMPLSQSTTPICKDLPVNAFAFDIKDASLTSTEPGKPSYSIGTTFIIDPTLKPMPTNLVLVGHKTRPNDYHVREYCVIDYHEDGTEVYELRASNRAFPLLKDAYIVMGVAVATVNMLMP